VGNGFAHDPAHLPMRKKSIAGSIKASEEDDAICELSSARAVHLHTGRTSIRPSGIVCITTSTGWCWEIWRGRTTTPGKAVHAGMPDRPGGRPLLSRRSGPASFAVKCLSKFTRRPSPDLRQNCTRQRCGKCSWWRWFAARVHPWASAQSASSKLPR